MSLTFLLLFVAYAKGINLLCEHWKWSVVLGNWTFNRCELDNVLPLAHSSMIWIGQHDKSSLNWTNYTITSTIIANSDTGNGGIAFHIQNVEAIPDGGTYYALSLFANQDRVDFAKFDDGFHSLSRFNSGIVINPGEPHIIEIICSSINEYTFKIDNETFGPFSDYLESPPLTSGSVGFRNYYLPMNLTNFQISFPDN
mmetsp:Transcript_95265/g.116630  ORF Transcript_95265/g.116630 Transcript_95265/m.116630 type:complete len:198 (+) Transcript_95265:35-628(+)